MAIKLNENAKAINGIVEYDKAFEIWRQIKIHRADN